jgi:rare lipoprotein A
MQRGLTNILATLAVVTSLAAAPQSSNPSSTDLPKNSSASQADRSTKPYQVGKASWYGKFFHGKPTASGEPYDMFLFTAAHRELPLGTMVKVTNLKNGKSLVVRINDRGPVPLSRVIDLSYGAAQMLGFRQGGVERIRIDLLENSTMASLRRSRAGAP